MIAQEVGSTSERPGRMAGKCVLALLSELYHIDTHVRDHGDRVSFCIQ